MHGVSLCFQTLLAQASRLPAELVHLDSRFTDSHDSLGKFSLRKFARLLSYLARLIRLLLFGNLRAVVTTPTFYFKPFLKDALFIWCAWLFRKPVFGWIHNDFRLLAAEMMGWKLFVAKLTLRRLKKLILVAPRLQQYAPDWLEADRFSIIANGVPDPLHRRNAPERPRQPQRFVYLSQMNEAKGWKDLLAATKLLAARGLHPEVHFYGRPAFETTEAMIQESFTTARSEGSNVAWHGPIYDEMKWAMLAEADAFIFPSWHEAFPLALLDSMAVGLPIIATDVGGVADALDDKLGGHIVPPQQPIALANAMETLLSENAEALGTHNRQRYEQSFTAEAYADRWAAFLRNNLYESN